MDIITELTDVKTLRKQELESDVYSRLTDAAVVPDLTSGSQFGSVGLESVHLRRSGDRILNFILSEYDPRVRSELRALYARRERLRAQLEMLSQHFDRAHYSRLISDCTLGYHVIQVVRGYKEYSAYEWSIDHGRWKTIQNEERITRTEFYQRLLRYARLSSAARRSAYEALRQSRLADKALERSGQSIPENYVWRTNPRTIRIRNIPLFDGANRAITKGANLHSIMMRPIPIYGPKKVPLIDWDRVRRLWSERLAKIQPQQEALLRELRLVDGQLLDLRPQSTHRFNRCVQLSSHCFQAKSRQARLLSAELCGDFFPRLPVAELGHIGWLPGDPSSGLTWSPGSGYLAPVTVSDAAELADNLSDLERQCLEYDTTGVYPSVPASWEIVPGNPRCYLCGNDAISFGLGRSMHMFRHFDLEPNVQCHAAERQIDTACGDPIRLDEHCSPNRVDEVVQSALNALLAGRASGSEDTSFNLTRSLGETKDLPKTETQSFGFIRWLITGGANQQLYKFRVKGRKTPIYAPLRYLRKDGTLYGVRIVSYKAVQRIPTLAMLASAYLGLKFAIQPTIADARRLGRESFADLSASRRFLTRLYRLLGSRTKFTVLRRGFLIGKPVKLDKPVAIGESLLRQRPEIPFRDSISMTRDMVIAIMNCDATPFSVATLSAPEGASFTVPYVETLRGLRYYLFYDSSGNQLSADQRTRCSRDAYRRAREILPPELYASPFLYKSWVRGCVFARYGRNALRILAEDPTLAAKLDRLKIVKTAWDLSPASFVLEWFTNLGDIIQNAQDILSTDQIGIQPIGGPWYCATERFAMSRLSGPENCSLTQRLLRAEYYPYLWITTPRGDRQFATARVEMVPSHLEWEWSVVDNTTGRPISRREWLNELRPHLIKTGAAVTNRMPIVWERELPSFRPSLRLDTGKGLTLLAMYLSGLRK